MLLLLQKQLNSLGVCCVPCCAVLNALCAIISFNFHTIQERFVSCKTHASPLFTPKLFKNPGFSHCLWGHVAGQPGTNMVSWQHAECARGNCEDSHNKELSTTADWLELTNVLLFVIQMYKFKWIQDNYDTGSPSPFHPCALSRVEEESREKGVCRSEHPTSFTHVAIQNRVRVAWALRVARAPEGPETHARRFCSLWSGPGQSRSPSWTSAGTLQRNERGWVVKALPYKFFIFTNLVLNCKLRVFWLCCKRKICFDDWERDLAKHRGPLGL